MIRDAVVVVGWLAGWWRLARLRSLPRARQVEGPALVVPARDEAGSLPRLLDSVGRQRPAPAEVVVVDDDSSDGTAEVVRRAGATVLASGGPPPGWLGKPWACQLGAEHTHAPQLVFVDADVRFVAGDAMARVLTALQEGPGAVSVQPWHRCERPGESTAMFFNLVAVMAADRRAGFGPVLACRRAEYLEAGGHAAVRAAVLEDTALAGRFADSRWYAGRGAVEFRMYPGGVREVVRGFARTVSRGAAAATAPVPLLLTLVWVVALASVVAGLPRPDAIAGYVAVALQLAVGGRRVGRYHPWAVVAWPLTLAFFVAVCAWSVVARPTWKGRRITV